MSVLPEHTGLLLDAEAVGSPFTVTVVVAEAEQDPFETITVYNPLAAVVTLLMTGFCKVDVKKLGPDHE